MKWQRRRYQVVNSLYAIALPILGFGLVVWLDQDSRYLLVDAFGFALFYAVPAALMMFVFNGLIAPD